MKTCCLFLFVSAMLAADLASAQSLAPASVFESNEVFAITLSANFEKLLSDVGEERSEHEAVITYPYEGRELDLAVKLKTRGKFRRNPENCNFPPLRINFSKKTSTDTIFRGLDKIKLVTHCQNNNEDYEQYVVQEYLLYRVYNQLSNASFRVRLLQITYTDSASKYEDMTTVGFLIEDEDVMAARLDAEVFENEDLKRHKVNYEQLTLLHLFEYMIGNIDWSVPIQHNMKLIGKTPKSTMMPVPYDFDHAGVIDAAYADEAPKIGTASLRYQLFREFCRDKKELQSYFDLFNDRKASIFSLYQNQQALSEASRHNALRHFERFYRTINDPSAAEKTFINPCQENG